MGKWRRIFSRACLLSGLALLGYAIYIAVTWPATPPDVLDTGWMSLLSEKSFVAVSVAWLGVCAFALGLLVRGLFGD
jgi:hypothetical protein